MGRRGRSVAVAGSFVVLAGCASQSAEPEAPKNAGPKDWQCQAPEGVSAEDARKVVVIRVLVAKDGTARDAKGNAVEAWSPPIKVHFTSQ